MAIAFVRVKVVKRSQSKNIVCKAAYIDRCELIFEGTSFQLSEVYDFSYHGKTAFREVYLPSHVDEKFKDCQVLWNAVEKFEKRKDSQVGQEFLIALPDDNCITIEDRIYLVEKFIQTHIVSKGYAAHAAIHQPDKRNIRISEDTEKKEIIENNWHCHILVPPRIFNETGNDFSKKKVMDLFPIIRKHCAVDGVKNWGKMWAQMQNDYFEEKGLNLRVDPEGIVSQIHLGPVRMRSRGIYTDLEQQDQNVAMNQILSKNSSSVLEKLTSTKSIFTFADAEAYFRKHVPENEIPEVRESFWKNEEIVELFKRGNNEFPKNEQLCQKFTTLTVIEEEKKIIRLADRIQSRSALKFKRSISSEEYKKGLNQEQRIAFDGVISGSSLSCIEGHAGTGKSYLLAALQDFYKSIGYTVRAFGPDNATARVLEEKGFQDASNIHKFLFSKHFKEKDYFSKNEVWIVDESGKVGNKSLLELLKQAEKSGAQVIFSGNSAQLPSVERGGMFKKFCEKYGCEVLIDIQRQKAAHQREISLKLAKGDSNAAINMIAATGGFSWASSKEDSIVNLVEKWMQDRVHHPYSSQLIIAHSNEEVRAINEIAHLYRKSCGEISEKEFKCETAYGKISVSEGDLIEFRKNDSKLGVTNGQTAILLNASENKFILKTQGESKEREIIFDPTEYTSYQLGYASTYFRSQGQTVDRAYVLYSKYINKPLFYVGLTRHVLNAHCFVSHMDARFLSDIKMQAKRDLQKESSLDYITQFEIEAQKQSKEMKEKINNLCNSSYLMDRFKGGSLRAWTSVKSQISGYVEKLKDRRDSEAFYNVKSSDLNKRLGRVVEIHQESPLENSQKIVAKIGDEKSMIESSSIEPKEKAVSQKNRLNLSENKKTSLREYFDKVDEAATLYSIVKAEASNSNIDERQAASFLKWQRACVERNKAAHTISHSFSPKDLKEILGAKSFEILRDRTEKHENYLSPKINVSEKLKENLEPLLHKLFPEGPTGKDSKGFRFGSKGSLSVICKGERAGCFFDFENQKGGNVLQLIQTKLGINEAEAKEWAQGFLNNPGSSYVPKQYAVAMFNKSEDKEWISLIPPKEAPVPSLREISRHLDDKYTLAAKYPYYDSNGNIVLYNLRLQEKENSQKKTILPISFGRLNQSAAQPKWGLKKYQFENDKNPIYNSIKLRENPLKPVLIVEGEKAADAGNLLFNNMVTISWFGGSGSAKRVDWSPLYGREVIIWADNDKAGFKAAEEITGSLRQVGVKSLKVVDSKILVNEFPEKWDIADPLPQGKEIGFLKECIHRAEHRAVSIDRIAAMLNVAGKNGKDQTEVRRLNEILWRVDERMRPNLENEFKSKPWEIEKRILSEVSVILQSEKELIKMTASLSGHKDVTEGVVYQSMLHQARTGVLPSLNSLEEIKKMLIICSGVVSQHLQFDEKTFSYALGKTCMMMAECRVQDKAKINEYFQSCVREVATPQMVDAMNSKTKAMEIIL